MPNFIPFHKEMILLSGVAEIVLGFLLLFKKARIYALWGNYFNACYIYVGSFQYVNSTKQSW